MHLTSVVRGRLLPELTAMDALKTNTSCWNSFRSTKGEHLNGNRKTGRTQEQSALSATGDMDLAIAIEP